MPRTTTPPAAHATRRAAAILLAALVALATLASSTSPASAEWCGPAQDLHFSDVGATHPFCREIEAARSQLFVNGYADGTYRPTNVVTRQAAAAILFRVATHDQLIAMGDCVVPPFPDVPVDHPLCPWIRSAADLGIFSGYADGTFRPGAPMTRRAAAITLSRVPDGPQLLLVPFADPFVDVPVGHPLAAYAAYVKGAGILTGYPDGTFRPDDPMTRQAFAAVALRTWNHISD